MAGAKLVVIYPRSTDVERFERVYTEEHIPMAVEKLHGKTKIVATRVVGSPSGTPPFYRIAEIHFPSLEALNACAASEEAQGDNRSCRIHLHRRQTYFPCGRRGDSVLRHSERGRSVTKQGFRLSRPSVN